MSLIADGNVKMLRLSLKTSLIAYKRLTLFPTYSCSTEMFGTLGLGKAWEDLDLLSGFIWYRWILSLQYLSAGKPLVIHDVAKLSLAAVYGMAKCP